MKAFLVSLVLVPAVVASVPACRADNCARAVTGTRAGKVPGVSSRMEDCSSFMLATVTPAPTTVTTTITIIAGDGITQRDIALEARQETVQPTSVPTYASACSGTVRYSSACSCWGITAMTTTVPTPTVTATVTTTVSGCVGGTCGTYNSQPCNDGQDSCSCYTDADGNGVCAVDEICSGIPTCVANSDCPPGNVCAVNTCCGPSSVCLPVAPGQCANSLSPRNLFVKPRGKRSDCTSSHC